MEKKEKKLYTLLVYSENIAGLLNQITAVFTRRQLNIESLNVSASSISGIHKYTITAWSDEEQILLVTNQIEKKIDDRLMTINVKKKTREASLRIILSIIRFTRALTSNIDLKCFAKCEKFSFFI